MRLTVGCLLLAVTVLASNVGADTTDVEDCARSAAQLQTQQPVAFAAASAVMLPASRPSIDALALIAVDCPNARIIIEGHTDDRGSDALNLQLSQARAQAVVDALTTRGLDAARMTARGLGSLQPIASNDTRAGRAKNRRIVVSFVDR
ncbi:MAG: OmpA family protein [Pseudomonadota bacterium]